MNHSGFTNFLERSLALLDRQAPAAYGAVVTTLGARSVNIEVDHERLALRAAGSRLVIVPLLPRATTSARTSRPALRRLLEGEQNLTSAILTDEVALYGSVEDLTTLYEALLCYFRGAVRSPGFPALLDDFLGPPRSGRQLTQSLP
jgi:hypothetical protein